MLWEDLLLRTSSGLIGASYACCCNYYSGSGSGSGAEVVANPCVDGCDWANFELIDQSGGCVCMQDTVNPLTGGTFWGASGCEGSINGSIFCEDGVWKTTVTGIFPTGTATVEATVYTPCVEIIFELPTLACMTASSGTAKLRITP
jgi:hypothetical protein